MIPLHVPAADHQARLLAEADARRLARAAQQARPPTAHHRAASVRRPRLVTRVGEALVATGRRLAPESEDCLPAS
ncbi:MAG: hypothetical protein ACHQ15_05205 [Candidatus Limnocylindrales bacterium]